MTPEQKKAEELIDKMRGSCCMCDADARDAAIACVDEIINTVADLHPAMNSNVASYSITYWESVKQHLLNL